jgi:DNA-binding IclR family transcriptional regulator
MVGLHKSTTAGIIGTLKAEGFLEQDALTGRLRLGLELFTLAVNARRELGIICEPYLNHLLEMTGETVNLAVLDPDRAEIVYIAKKESTQSIRIGTSVGKRLPVYCTAIGKSILACMDRNRAESLVAGVEMAPLTPRTITSWESLSNELDRIARCGVAYDEEEFEPGVVCVAAPVYYREREPVGAVSVSGPSMRMDAHARKKIAAVLRGVVEQIRGEMSKLAG